VQPTYDIIPGMGKINTVLWYFPDKEPSQSYKKLATYQLLARLFLHYNIFIDFQFITKVR